MATDIHWIIERRHANGDWYPVLSKSYVFNILFEDHVAFAAALQRPVDEMPHLHLGGRSYAVFACLSSVRDEDEDTRRQIAQTGTPDRLSDYSRDFWEEEGDLHSYGWFTPEMLRQALEERHPHTIRNEGEASNLAWFATGLSRVIARADLMDNILFGRIYDSEADISHPDMVKGSGHDRIHWRFEAQRLLPVSDGTVRILIAYDN